MNATLQEFVMTDLARGKRVDVKIGGDGAELTPAHTVGHAVDLYLNRMQIRDRSLRWQAFSRGIMLDAKSRLDELETTDTQWTVMPEVAAGAVLGADG